MIGKKLNRENLTAAAHFVVTFLCYYNFYEHPQRDDFLSFLVFPFLIGAPSFLCGLIGLIAEIVINRRKSENDSSKQTKIANWNQREI